MGRPHPVAAAAAAAKTHLVFFALSLNVLLCPFLVPVQGGPACTDCKLLEFQPDNTTSVALYIRGDEDYSYYVDEEGYTVLRDEHGWLVYAGTSPGEDGDTYGTGSSHDYYGLIPSQIRLGHHSPAKSGIRRGLMPSDEYLDRVLCGGTDDCDEWHYNHQQYRFPTSAHDEPEQPYHYDYSTDDNDDNGDISQQQRRRRRRTQFRTSNYIESSQTTIRTTGTFSNLVILLRFAHSKQTKFTLPTRQQIATLMNSPAPNADVAPTGSVYSAYREYSYGKVDIKSSITPWIRVRRNERSSSDRGNFKKALYQALTHLKKRNRIDARNYDSVTVLHSGYGAEHGSTDCHGNPSKGRVWAHSGSLNWMGQSIRYGVSSALWGNCGSDIARVGMIAHELGHALFRLPDLYDKGRGSGVGAFDLMSYAWGKDNSQYYPPHPSAWTKTKLNWITPTTIKKSGKYALYPSETNPIVYRINGGYPKDEYLLVEFRKDVGFDKALGCGGAVIYHIDDTAPRQSRPGFPRTRGPAHWPTNGDHYQVAIAQRDRRFDLEKGENTGQCEDIWGRLNGLDDMFGPGDNAFSSYPNSDSYKGGKIQKTGIRIYEFEKSDQRLKFTVTGPYLGRDRPTTRSENERIQAQGQNNPGTQRVNNKNNKNCKDDKEYIYKASSGAKYDCAYAKDNKHVCRRKDPNTKKFFWQYCRATCRSLFLKQERNPLDICAS